MRSSFLPAAYPALLLIAILMLLLGPSAVQHAEMVEKRFYSRSDDRAGEGRAPLWLDGFID